MVVRNLFKNQEEGKEMNEQKTQELTQAMLDEVQQIYDDYLVFPSNAARDAVVLWTAHTHVYERFENSPRLSVVSTEPGSGKTRVLEMLEHLAPHPQLMTNFHPAVLWRSIEQHRQVSLLLDEVDTIFGKAGSASAHQQLRSLINSGYRKGAKVVRCMSYDQLREYNAYAPVAMAGIGKLPETIQTRSITIPMRKRRGGEQIRPFRLRFAKPELDAAKLTLEEWGYRCGKVLELSLPEMPVSDRLADIWEPLFAIAELAGDEWLTRCHRACKTMTRESKSMGEILLTDLFHAFASDDRVTLSELVLRLLDQDPGDDEVDWTEDLIDVRKLASTLREYDIEPVTIRSGDRIAKGYKASAFTRHWRRLGLVNQPEFSLEERDVTA